MCIRKDWLGMKLNRIDSSVTPQNESPSFKRKLPPEIIEHINNNSGKVAKFLNYVGENQGEALNILVTAVGTAGVCPLFIAFNPLSKEDSKTKQYSAWRQPISAAITVATQLTITNKFNDYMARRASTMEKRGKGILPHFARTDLTACPHERYLKKIIKYEHPEWDKKQVAKEVEKRQKIAEKKAVSRLRNEMKNSTIETKDLLCQDYYDKAKKQLIEKIKTEEKSQIENQFKKPIDDIWSTKLEKHLNKRLKEKAKAIGKTPETLIKETAESLVNRDVITEAVTKRLIRNLKAKGLSTKDVIDKCNSENSEHIKFIKGLIDEFSPEEKKTISLHTEKELDATKIAEDIVKKLEHMKEYEQTKQLEDFTSVKKIGNTFNEILHNVKIKKLVRSKTSDAKKVFKTQNSQMGLVVTLLTLPFTCGALNWAYPRIMEKIMPEMSAKKKETPSAKENKIESTDYKPTEKEQKVEKEAK